MNNIQINNEQQLYVIPCGKGYTCLGFDVCENRKQALLDELNLTLPATVKGTIEAYNQYQELISIVQDKNNNTGFRSKSELIPEFMGNEGKRVEIIDCYGEKRRFIIGKSTGFIPCHLEIKTKRSSGGLSVMGYPFKQITFLS